MAIKMLEKQEVDGVLQERGAIVTSDDFTERTLVAFGKAEVVVQEVAIQEVAAELPKTSKREG